jgi:diacylglycerol kinase (ATP)
MISSAYSTVFIIYNPKSTGEAAAKARRLHKRLQRKGLPSELCATQYAGHGREIAYRVVRKHKRPLIVSVSGDGGYNEVVNGVMQAKDEGSTNRPVCTIAPGGNANDHRRTIRKHPIYWAILHTKPESIDILRLEASGQNKQLLRYAHSYIGFGVTSKAAAELNRERLTRWKEVKIVLRTLLNFDPVTISHDKDRQKLDSLVFANIHQMSKIIRLGKRSNLHNGKFRVVAIPHRSRFRTLATMLSIVLFGFRNPPQTDAYVFELLDTQPVHFDGEVEDIAAGSQVRIACAKNALEIIR